MAPGLNVPPNIQSLPIKVGGWVVHEHEVVSSTHDLAVSLPPWHAVRAHRQTGGRGRFGRTWVSDPGGLWLSAVVPLSTNISGWEALPLVAGWAVIDAVRSLGACGLRMRWPNDVMIGDRKLAGLLVERPRTEGAVIGVGLNVTNDPASQDNALQCYVTRLVEVLEGGTPSLRDLTVLLLERLKGAVEELHAGGLAAFAERIDALWRRPSAVQLELDDQVVTGWFEGITGNGALRLRHDDGERTTFPAYQVKQLKELEHEP